MVEIPWNFTWVLLFVVWLWVLPTSLQFVAEKISLLGVYHTVSIDGDFYKNHKLDRVGIEKFSEKLKKVYSAYLYLTIVFMIAYYIIISDAVGEHNLDLYKTFCLSYVLTLVSLLTIRLLANQPRFIATNFLQLFPSGIHNSIQERQNEKTMAHFHTLICSALMILGIVVSASIIMNEDLKLVTIPQNIDVGSFLCAFGIYIVLLPIFTLVLEVVLLFSRPVIQIDK